MSGLSTPEPAPKQNERPAVWDLVISDVERLLSPETFGAARDLAIAGMRERDLTGFQKYGVRLQPDNGRDALVDAYQEALDLAVYLRQSITERYDGMVWALYHAAITQLVDLRAVIAKRRGGS